MNRYVWPALLSTLFSLPTYATPVDYQEGDAGFVMHVDLGAAAAGVQRMVVTVAHEQPQPPVFNHQLQIEEFRGLGHAAVKCDPPVQRPGEHVTLVGEGEFQTFALERVIVTLRMQEHEPVTAWFSGLSSKGS